MTSSGNSNEVVRSSIEAGIEGQEDNFLLTMKTFDFSIADDDDELDFPSQVTNPPNIIPASSDAQPSVLRSSQQPTVEMLQSLGIKVRDFAYESTLPPIAPIPRVPRQIQPSARSLKRTSREWEEEDGAPSRSSRPPFGRKATNAYSETNWKPNSLVRKPTEPLELDLPVPKRMMGCADLSRPFPFGGQFPFCRTPPRRPSASPPTSPLFGSPSQEASQESELIKTPPGAESWHIEDTSSIPASQLDTKSSIFVSEEVSFSQALSPEPSQLATSFLTPVRSSVAPLCISPPSPVVDALDSSHLISNSPGEPKRGIIPTSKASTERPPRYLLRRRSLLSAHAPTRSRYPHPLTPAKKGSPEASPLPRRRRLQQSALSR